jgi:hypothetical protein
VKCIRNAPKIFRDAIDPRATGQLPIRLSSYAVCYDSKTKAFIREPTVFVAHANESAMAYTADLKCARWCGAFILRGSLLCVQ